jgi:pyruvate/2-oxoacid:ferredoxin oxidoreductase alpha subunit
VVDRAAANTQRVIVPEMNLGQIALEVERIVGRGKVIRVGRADGHIVTPDEILDAMRIPLTQPVSVPSRALERYKEGGQ